MLNADIIKRSLIRATLVTVLIMGYLLLTEENPTSDKASSGTEAQPVLDANTKQHAQQLNQTNESK